MEKKEIKIAAVKAAKRFGSKAEFVDALPEQSSDNWSIRYREAPGKYFRVILDRKEIISRGENPTVETVTEEILRQLERRDPNDYLPGKPATH